MKLIYALLVIFLVSPIFAQDLHIYYDVHHDSMWYVKNGKAVEELSVKKGKKVYFHLVEFNNYIYVSEFDALQHALPPAGMGIDSSRFQGFVPGLLSGFFPDGKQPFLNIPVFGSLMGAVSGLQGNGNARGDREEILKFKKLLEDIEVIQQALNAQVDELNKRQKALTILKGNAEFVETICKSSSMAPSLIKQMSMDYFEEALMLEKGKKFELKDVDELFAKLTETTLLKQQTHERLLGYQQKVQELTKYITVLKSTDHGIDELYPLIKQYETNLPQLTDDMSRFEISLSKNFITVSDEAYSGLSSSIRNFYIKYIELLNNDFSFTHSAKTESRYLLYKLRLFRKDSFQNTSGIEDEWVPIKTLSLLVETYGEFSLGSSMGINVGKHGTTPQRYFVKNNVINAEADDEYAPLLSSFINVTYSVSPTFSPSLSFGVGMPLKSSENTESLTFFVGPSMTLGRNKTVMLTGGFMFSKINQLSNGLAVGQAIQIGEGVLPTQKRYDTGYYFGIAYTLGR